MQDEVQFCTFMVDDLYFGVEVLRVQEVIRYQPMTPVPLAPRVVEGLINLRGQIVTAIDLRKRLNLPARAEGSLPINVVVRTSEGVTSLLVDEIDDVVSVQPESFEKPPETLTNVGRELLSGVYKLTDRLLLVMDVERTISAPTAA